MKLNAIILENEIASRAMSYKELANNAGVTEKTLHQARRGQEIRTATAGRIAAALGVEVKQLINSQSNTIKTK